MIALGACATPIEVKQASKTQLELLTALEHAAEDLQQSLGQFHRAQQARIREEGRLWIARQAIDVAYPRDSTTTVTADVLFEGHKKNIQPWIDTAFLSDDIDATIGRLEGRLAKATDAALKIQLENELQTWRARKLTLGDKPAAVKDIEAVIIDDLRDDEQTAVTIDRLLGLLRAQIALMKHLAERVDAWLATDVTVNEEQADALRKEFAAAASALGGGK